MSRTDHEEVRTGLSQHLAALWRYGLVLSRNRDTAEDLVQATCVRALERSQQFLPGTRLDRWLFAIERSIWINELRARRVRQGAGVVDAEIALVVDGGREIETNILASQVLREIGRLAEAQRETVLLVYAEGFSYREAAEFLGVPIGTIMSRLATVREKLGGMADAPQQREASERGGDGGP
ncbi:RNA polymerase sigma factor [Kaistia sp. UC242_56]|jgi:RNA polymerase sigma-70 factor (ECF subfamily)|uniref:RNA polymerase sigma factor n=1 Tax=Kaistia sp. UC242_56 TaxID=3374625 RepID=UPI00337DDD4E|nr:RNA polymerase sigma factor [Kaistia sp.]